MESPVGRVIVFSLTGRAHDKASHRSVVPVVRQSFYDRKARAAIGAVRERITVMAIGGIEDFPQAIGACCDIGEDKRSFGA